MLLEQVTFGNMAKEQDDTLKGLGQYFADNTSMHGVSRIVGKPGFLRRSFWTLAVLGGAGEKILQMFLYHSFFKKNPCCLLAFSSCIT